MPRTKEQFENMRVKSKNLIIESALELFTKDGYHTTSINAIAKKAGVSVGLTYNYFNSKEDLLMSIIDGYFENFFSKVSNKLGGELLSKNMLKIIDAMSESIIEETSSWQLLISIMFQPDISASAKEKFNNFFLHQEGLFESYFKEIKVDNPERSANALVTILHGTFLHYAASGDVEAIRIVRETVIERLVTEGI